ncbi:MAG: fibronectin type III domain-containing protein [Treponema sp.]|jgi:hypothetical protein|nr:fibronectin type III domain-containing protein [Treponema sp.]
MRKWIFAALSALALILLSCSLDVKDDPPDNQANGTPNETPNETPNGNPNGTPNETPNETPSEDSKTYIEFQNHEAFPVRIYQDPSHLTLIAEAPAKGTKKVEASPNLVGVAFYPVYLLEIEGIPITQNGPAITVRVDEKKVNKVNIPVLNSIETGFAYVKIENASLYSLAFNQGGHELIPLSRDSTLIMPGETGAYQIEPQEAGVYSFMRNASSLVPFPDGIREFVRDTVYSFRYDGTLLTMSNVKPMIPAPQNIVLESGDGSITVTWDAVPRVSSYNVYYSTGETPPETPAQSGITGTTATINDLTNNTVYYVWVESVNSSGSTMSGSKVISLTLPAPQNMVLEPGDGSIIVTWEAVPIARSYNVYYSTSQTPPETPAQSGITGTTATINVLTNNTAYYVWVESVNSSGSAMSRAKSINLTLPAPQNVVLQAGNGSITVTWDAVSLASAYSVYYSTSQTPPGSPAKTGITGTTTTISGLTNNAAYYVWVASVNSGGSTLSAASSVTLLPGWNVASSQEFTAAIASINASSKEDRYTITLTNSISLEAVTFTMNAEKTIIIKGEGTVRTITNTGNAVLFTVPETITLLLENNILLDGNYKAYNAVAVDGGALVMNPGSRIINAKKSGVMISDSGTFTMEGGEIRGNTDSYGGGVYVDSGIFTMAGGIISGNTASISGSVRRFGGGVYVKNGIFTMKEGTISDNTASGDGGGVYMVNGTFTMKGGAISSNSAFFSTGSGSAYGGGVYMENGTFTMEGGTISDNATASYGGGVYMESGTFTMKGGTISDNTASRNGSGGGVYVGSSGTFTMEGGAISGNTASRNGGGVYVNSSGTFIKRSNSTIDTANSANKGKVAYVNSDTEKVRNTTAGPGVNLDSRRSGTAGGWE